MDISDLARHLITPDGDAFNVNPEQALAYWRAKGLRLTGSYADMTADEHRAAFTIAHMRDIDLLRDVRDSLDEALASGMPFRQWADEMGGYLQAKGWLGGDRASAWRLETIFRTNLQTAYAAGQWELIEEQAADAPFLLYDALDDGRTRPEHRAWDGTVLPVTSKWWRTHTPPCGYNCRCSVIQLDEADLERLGLQPQARSPKVEYRDWKNPRTGETMRIPVGVDYGFGEAAGERLARIERLHGEKIRALVADMRKAAKAGAAATAAAAEAAVAAEAAAKAPAFAYEAYKPLRTVREIEDWMLANVASTVNLPSGMKADGLNEAAQAMLEVNERFGMGKVRYLGTMKGDVHRYRGSNRFIAAFASRTDAYLITKKAGDPEFFKRESANQLRAGRPLETVLAILRDLHPGSERLQAIARRMLPDGLRWTTADRPRDTVYHEMGHRLHGMHGAELNPILSRGKAEGWHNLITRYGSTNVHEFMAEAFALYMQGDVAQYERIYPPLLEWFRKMDRRNA